MSNKNDFAFPITDKSQTPNGSEQLGLTKREYFAAAALNGLNETEKQQMTEKIASWAIELADEMLKQLGN